MGSFVFKWGHPATEVYVTGTFDDWTKSEKLEKVGDVFEKNVTLSDASTKILYKFVVDGDWVVDHTAPKENDDAGIENNVLTPDRIVTGASATTAIMSSAAPDSTTAALAADAPLEKRDDLPGAFPETPAAEPNGDAAFGVNPLPAAIGAVNPIKLAPGEQVPHDVSAQSTTSHVKLDAESYEKSDALPGDEAFAISSAAPGSTTAALAADAPIETKVPEIVKESQEKANVDPEASAVPEEVEEKAAVEKELLEKVTEAPSTSEGTAGQGTEKTENDVTPGEAVATVAATLSAAAGAALAGAIAAKDVAAAKSQEAVVAAQTTATSAAQQLPDSVKEMLPQSLQGVVGNISTESPTEEVREEVSPEAPVEVRESIIAADVSPEAAANTEAVEEKKAVEAELLSHVKTVDAADNGEPAREEVVSEIPAVVKESLETSGRSPEAAVNAEAVEEKKAVEAELLQEIKPADAAVDTTQKDAPATIEAPAATEAVEVKETPALAVPATTEAPTTSVAAATTETPAVKETSDVPAVTTTTETPETATNGAAAVESTTPAKSTEDLTASNGKRDGSPGSGDKKKKNRLSTMFGKVKARLSSKN